MVKPRDANGRQLPPWIEGNREAVQLVMQQRTAWWPWYRVVTGAVRMLAPEPHRDPHKEIPHPKISSLLGTNMSHLGTRKIIVPATFKRGYKVSFLEGIPKGYLATYKSNGNLRGV